MSLAYAYLRLKYGVEKALRDSEERYRNIVEISPQGIVFHQDGIIIYVRELRSSTHERVVSSWKQKQFSFH